MKHFISTEKKMRRDRIRTVVLEKVGLQIVNIFKIEIITMASPHKEDRTSH
jgi:hypothetical protein